MGQIMQLRTGGSPDANLLSRSELWCTTAAGPKKLHLCVLASIATLESQIGVDLLHSCSSGMTSNDFIGGS